MADLSITAASVATSSTASIDRTGTAGEAITRGEPVYKDSSDSNEYKLAAATSTASNCYGIAMADAADGQPLPVCTKDPGGLTIGSTVVVGTVYVVSATAGGIAPIADMTTGDYVCVLGVADTTSTIKLDSGVIQQAEAAIA